MSTRQAIAHAGLWSFVETVRPEMERALRQYLPLAPARMDEGFNEALRYALFPGGKRLRPVLTLLGAELVGGQYRAVLAAAAAVEYLHTSSLIFDDLPCMDDAAERRGRAALHRRYGEGRAVLAALALMNASYGLIFDGPDAGPEQCVRAHRELVSCIGADGMVIGQTVDLAARAGREIPDGVRNLKTSALMRLSLRVGAILSGANARQLEALSRFAELLGQAYQLSDDVIDRAEDAALSGLLGVPADRSACLSIARGGQAAHRRIAKMVAQAKDLLTSEFGRSQPSFMLGEVADYIAGRAA